MSFPISTGETNPFSINADRTPLNLDESTRTLYNRAISDPSSLTDQERRLVTHRPLPEEENTLCQNACGLSMDELIAKAIDSNNNNNNNNDLSLGLSNDDIRNIQVAMEVPWQEHVLQSSSTSTGDSSSGGQSLGEAGARFGLVVFYQEEGVGRLSEYKSQIETAIYHGLHYSVSLIKDETRNRFTLHWVAVPGSHSNDLDPSALRTRFSTMLSNNGIPIGFRRDAFLYVDKEAFHSRETVRPYLWLAEPESKPEYETGPGTGAQPGVYHLLKSILSISPPHCLRGWPSAIFRARRDGSPIVIRQS
ncbi:hypothetical protein AARAC_003185 [Aspergillus arachidicola]|uniref:Uncharacterized protein n=1 Tax=Aspergillus arachidicola TaxID=656916 RepID=A0A2G7G9R2_9EURO|nr:hypothetical protein AARAC_003185 [Aspergillus arachidicola]